MHLQFVGCGDAFGSGGRFNTCFHLVGNEINALIDCGATSLVAMNKLKIDRNAIEVVFISHFHADHIAGLPFLLLEANYVTKRTRPLTVVGPPGLKTRFPDVMESGFPGTRSMELNFPLHLVELEIGKRNEIGAVRVTPFHVVHDDRAGPCLGFRFEIEGKVIAFSGDTEWTDALLPIADRAQLLIVECSGYGGRIPYHLTWKTLKSRLSDLRTRQIMITHMNPAALAHLDEIRAAGVLIAADGLVVDL